MESAKTSINLEKENMQQQLAVYKGTEVSKVEIDKILSSVNTDDLSTITKYGEGVATGVSQAAKIVLNNTNLSQLEKSSTLMNSLSKIMKTFDIDEIKEEPKGFFAKLWGNAQKQLEKLFAKYTSVGAEVEKIYVELKGFEREIDESNRNLEKIFNETIGYYKELLKYIAAGEEGIKLIDAEIDRSQSKLEETNDSTVTFDITGLRYAKDLFEQRVLDLKTAEASALQSIPMLKTLVYTNAMLNRKINSAFIVTLPVFEQALADAITARRQRIQAESLKALDEQTAKMIERNAQNVVETATLATKLAGSSAIPIESLEKSWTTIMQGIEEQKRLSAEISEHRKEEMKRLSALNEQFFKKST